MERVSDKDLKVIKKQLGREINNVIGVCKYCSYGFPVVISSYPIRNGKPFPTIHYLTCPHLVKEVSRLEEKGYISKFEIKIKEDSEFSMAYENAHLSVIQKRLNLLRGEDKKWAKHLESVGTGGIKDFKNVKCLHLHLADYLAGIENPVGKEVYDLIEKKECDTGGCGGEI